MSATTVTVIGDGAVGLSAVLAAERLGAERIILMGRHKARTDLGREWGATDVVAERGDEGIERVRELTGGPAPVRAYVEELLPDVLAGRASNPAGCSTAPSTSTACPTATAR